MCGGSNQEYSVSQDKDVNERNACMTALHARMRLRARVSATARRVRDVWMTALEDPLTRAKMRVVKRYLRRIEMKWLVERIEECRDLCERGRIGDKYKC